MPRHLGMEDQRTTNCYYTMEKIILIINYIFWETSITLSSFQGGPLKKRKLKAYKTVVKLKQNETPDVITY